MQRFFKAGLLAACFALSGGDASAKQLFGFIEEWGWGTGDSAERRLRVSQLARPLGVNVQRVNVIWQSIEPTPGAFNWWSTDSPVSYLRTQNVKITLCLLTSPAWTHPGDSRPCAAPAPAYDFYWARIARELARRYPDCAIQVWNEPNILPFGSIPPERYGQMLKIACDAIRSVNPGATIVSAGISPQKGRDGWPGWEEYYRRYLGLVADKNFKVGMHPYPRNVAQSTANEIAQSTLQQIKYVKSITPRRIWITEVGVSTGDVSATKQAKCIELIYKGIRPQNRIQALLIFRLQDPTNRPDSAWESGLGVCRTDYSPKPAYWTLKRLRN